MNNHDPHGGYRIVMPFVVCQSKGGPYEDQALVAGFYLGCAFFALHGKPDTYEDTVPSGLVPQLDLAAMHFGYSMSAEPWDQAPEEWTFVRFTVDAGPG